MLLSGILLCCMLGSWFLLCYILRSWIVPCCALSNSVETLGRVIRECASTWHSSFRKIPRPLAKNCLTSSRKKARPPQIRKIRRALAKANIDRDGEGRRGAGRESRRGDGTPDRVVEGLVGGLRDAACEAHCFIFLLIVLLPTRRGVRTDARADARTVGRSIEWSDARSHRLSE